MRPNLNSPISQAQENKIFLKFLLALAVLGPAFATFIASIMLIVEALAAGATVSLAPLLMLGIGGSVVMPVLAVSAFHYVRKLLKEGPDEGIGPITFIPLVVGLAGAIGLTLGMASDAAFTPAGIAVISIFATAGLMALGKIVLESYLRNRRSTVSSASSTESAAPAVAKAPAITGAPTKLNNTVLLTATPASSPEETPLLESQQTAPTSGR